MSIVADSGGGVAGKMGVFSGTCQDSGGKNSRFRLASLASISADLSARSNEVVGCALPNGTRGEDGGVGEALTAVLLGGVGVPLGFGVAEGVGVGVGVGSGQVWATPGVGADSHQPWAYFCQEMPFCELEKAISSTKMP